MTDQEILELYHEAAVSLEQLGYDAGAYANYSGRFMYGNRVPAIVTNAPPVLLGWAITCAWWQVEKNIEDLQEFLPLREDSMGLSRVYY